MSRPTRVRSPWDTRNLCPVSLCEDTPVRGGELGGCAEDTPGERSALNKTPHFGSGASPAARSGVRARSALIRLSKQSFGTETVRPPRGHPDNRVAVNASRPPTHTSRGNGLSGLRDAVDESFGLDLVPRSRDPYTVELLD